MIGMKARIAVATAAAALGLTGAAMNAPEASAAIHGGNYRIVTTVGGAHGAAGFATVRGNTLTVYGNGVSDGRYRIHQTRAGGYVDDLRWWNVVAPTTRWNFVQQGGGYFGGSYIAGIRTGSIRLIPR